MADHGQVGVLIFATDSSHGAAIAVLGLWGDLGPVAKAEVGEVLLGSVPERLRFFWGVDAGKTDCQLLLNAVAAGLDGVAVADGDDQAEEGSGEQWVRKNPPERVYACSLLSDCSMLSSVSISFFVDAICVSASTCFHESLIL